MRPRFLRRATEPGGGDGRASEDMVSCRGRLGGETLFSTVGFVDLSSDKESLSVFHQGVTLPDSSKASSREMLPCGFEATFAGSETGSASSSNEIGFSSNVERSQ